jgi:anti-sigma regulatory factor (Ser/Thr protein kinase)
VNGSLNVLPHPHVADGPRRGSAWPLESYLELGAYPTAVPCARLHARLVVTEWGLGSLADAAELVVSELVTNAVRAAYGLTRSTYQGRRQPGLPPVRLWLQSDYECLIVMVWDGSDRMPQRADPNVESQRGRGLWLVEARSDEWGAFKREHASGKVVWARIVHG